MTFLPIVERELRVASRSSKMYWSRVGVALFTVGIGLWLLFILSHIRGGASAGRELFKLLTTFGFYFSLMAGVAQSADAISRENREGTLGLLFLTDLSGLDIVLGKLAAASLVSFYSLVAALPIAGLSLMLGGITWMEFVTTALALINSLFFAHAIGLFTSCGQIQAQKAIGWAVLFLVFLVVILPLVQFVPAANVWTILISKVALLSPAYAFAQATMPFGGSVWLSLLCSHLLAWGFLFWASRRASECWKVKAITTVGWRARWQQWILGSQEFRLAQRRELLDQSGYLWLIHRGRFRKWGFWFGFIVICAAGLSLRVGPTNLSWKPTFLFWIAGWHFLLKALVAVESSRHLDAQKRNGELEMLLCGTPLTNEDIFHAHFLGLKRLLGLPLIVVLSVDVLVWVLGCFGNDGRFMGMSAELAYGLAIPFAVATLLLDLWALRWIGLWMGISSRKAGQSMGAALARIFTVPVLLIASGEMLFYQIRIPQPVAVPLAMIGWVAACALNNFGFVAWSKYKLRTDFRYYALPQVDEALTFWGRLGRILGKSARLVLRLR